MAKKRRSKKVPASPEGEGFSEEVAGTPPEEVVDRSCSPLPSTIYDLTYTPWGIIFESKGKKFTRDAWKGLTDDDWFAILKLSDQTYRKSARGRASAFLTLLQSLKIDIAGELPKIRKMIDETMVPVIERPVPIEVKCEGSASMATVQDERLEAMMCIALASQYEMHARPGAILRGWPSTDKSMTAALLLSSPIVTEEDVLTEKAIAPGTVEGKINPGMFDHDFKKAIIVADASTAIVGNKDVIKRQLGLITKAIDDDHMWITDGNGVKHRIPVQSTLMVGMTTNLYKKMLPDLVDLGNRLMIIPFYTNRAVTKFECRTKAERADKKIAVFSILERARTKHTDIAPISDEMIAEATRFAIKITTLRSLADNDSKQGGEGQNRVANQLVHAGAMRAMLWDREPGVGDVKFFEQFYYDTIPDRAELYELCIGWKDADKTKKLAVHALKLELALPDIGFLPDWASFIVESCHACEDDWTDEEMLAGLDDVIMGVEDTGDTGHEK
jgi:hypothetical protein